MTPSLHFDHLGLIVADLATGRQSLENTLGVTLWSDITHDSAMGVSVQFGAATSGGPTYELISPLGDDSPIANALRQGKHILNHVAYLTPNLDLSAAGFRDQGCFPACAPRPAAAYGGARVQFWLSPLRFIIELIEKPNHLHAFTYSVVAGPTS